RDVLEAMKGLRRLDHLGPFSPAMDSALDHVGNLEEPDMTQEKDDLPTELPLHHSQNDQNGSNGASHTPDQTRQMLLSYLSPTPCDIDQLVYATGLSADKILFFF